MDNIIDVEDWIHVSTQPRSPYVKSPIFFVGDVGTKWNFWDPGCLLGHLLIISVPDLNFTNSSISFEYNIDYIRSRSQFSRDHFVRMFVLIYILLWISFNLSTLLSTWATIYNFWLPRFPWIQSYILNRIS